MIDLLPHRNRLISEHSVSGPWGVQPYLWCWEELGRMGWRHWIGKFMQPLYDLGCRRFLLRCPWGQLASTRPEDPIHYDVLDHALKLGARSKIHWGFASAMREFLSQADPPEVIAYIGRPQAYEGQIGTAWWTWFLRNAEPFVSVGCSLGFDAIAAMPDSGPQMEAMHYLQARGIRVYVEGHPTKDHPAWANFPAISTEVNYYHAVHDGHIEPLRNGQELVIWGWHNEKFRWSGIQQKLNEYPGQAFVAGLYTALIENGGRG